MKLGEWVWEGTRSGRVAQGQGRRALWMCETLAPEHLISLCPQHTSAAGEQGPCSVSHSLCAYGPIAGQPFHLADSSQYVIIYRAVVWHKKTSEQHTACGRLQIPFPIPPLKGRNPKSTVPVQRMRWKEMKGSVESEGKRLEGKEQTLHLQQLAAKRKLKKS